MTKVSNNERILCSVCRKRDAVYRRRSSGELLCRLCLFRSIVRQVRKAVRYYKMVNKLSTVLFVIRPEAVEESIVSFYIYKGATKDLQLTYNVICFNSITNCSIVKHYIGRNVDNFIEVGLNFKTSNLVELIKFVEAVAVKIANKHNIKFIVTPLFRDELTLLSVLGILTTSRTIFSEGLPIKVVDEIKITRPFFYVISPDVSIIKTLDNIVIDSPIIIECDRFMQKAKKLLFNSIELLYSSIKSVELLQSYAFGTSTRCRYCGAFSLEPICDVCKKFQISIDASDLS
ncbi:MAG: hypothetical protein QXL96_05890 [Ignisphaera sp.]